MKNILINVPGFMGDILFASSVAEQIKKQLGHNVWLKTNIASPIQYISLNPFIDGIVCKEYQLKEPLPTEYEVIDLPTSLHYVDTPMVELQKYCNIPELVNDFKIYNYKHNKIRKGKRVIGVAADWELRSFLFTEEEYKKGIDVPNLGYGGTHRNIQYILSNLKSNDVELKSIGLGPNVQYNFLSVHEQVEQFNKMVSDLLTCDFFIGAEGGLSNLCYALRIPTLLTSDFVHQLYGWNGVLKKVGNPKLGNIFYENNYIHRQIQPYATDDEVIQFIKDKI